MRRLGLLLLLPPLALSCSDDGLAPIQSTTGTLTSPTTGPDDSGGDELKLDLGGADGTTTGAPPFPTGTTSMGEDSGTGNTGPEEGTSSSTGGSSSSSDDGGSSSSTDGGSSSSSDGGSSSSSGGMMLPCPDIAGTSIIGGPADLYGFCWYLTAPMDTCDSACAELVGGSNLALMAEAAYPDNCAAPAGNDVSTWFFNNGNPGGWTGMGAATGAHTLGYGYSIVGNYYGKCSSGGVEVGTYPGEMVGGGLEAERQLICACALGTP